MLTKFDALEPAVDPNNRITFLLDWELTMKCNLDCSYCRVGIDGGHDNSTNHPPLDNCLKTIDFMFKYVDLYMNTKSNGFKHVVLNVYGGESLHHPDIVKILEQVRIKYMSCQRSWQLTVTTTTNAIVSDKKLKQIIPLIDEFTVSYHAESTDRQKQQFKNNVLAIAVAKKRLKCVVLMHQDPDNFANSQDMIAWLNQNNIKLLPRQLDGHYGIADKKRIYSEQQVTWFNNLYDSKSFNSTTNLSEKNTDLILTDVGRACCGGRQLCADQSYKQRQFFVQNKFPDWYCSVNHFFLYVKQVNGEIFVNKDCKMNFDGTVGPIGNLNDVDTILFTLDTQLTNNSLPIIQCKKSHCLCGLCAPKAKTLSTYNHIMEKYQL
jgi:hypothetical protein